MKANDNLKAVTNTACHRSIFDWGSNMQVIRKGNGEVAMTESELVDFRCNVEEAQLSPATAHQNNSPAP